MRLPAIGIAATLAASVGLPWLKAESTGGAFSLAGQTAAGGGRSGGGSYSLAGVVLTPAGGKSVGGAYVLSGGLWAVVVVPSGHVVLALEKTESGQARLSWPPDAVGYQLEFTTALGPTAVWSPVSPTPAGNVFLTPMNQPVRFFRLRKP